MLHCVDATRLVETLLPQLPPPPREDNDGDDNDDEESAAAGDDDDDREPTESALFARIIWNFPHGATCSFKARAVCDGFVLFEPRKLLLFTLGKARL